MEHVQKVIAKSKQLIYFYVFKTSIIIYLAFSDFFDFTKSIDCVDHCAMLMQ